MDGESSYESDISESWSLIDLNIEESHDIPETLKIKKTFKSDFTNSTSPERDDVELQDFLEKCEVYKTDLGLVSGSGPKSFSNNEDYMSCGHQEVDQIHFPYQRNMEKDQRNDANDTESIEILDIDGNYRDSDIERLDSAFNSSDSLMYKPDDEKLSKEYLNGKYRSCCSSKLMKRKRRKSGRNSDCVIKNFNGEDKLEKIHSKLCSNEVKNGVEKLSNSKFFEGSSPIVYKHYRNNVANTVLSLSMGVIFAGVACIAIGHFLGVQDATETARDLVETLKKLQVEKAALQSQLFHLNKSLLNRETSAGSGPLPSKLFCEDSKHITSRVQKTDLNNNAFQSEMGFGLNSIDWLSKLKNLILSDARATDKDVNLKGFEVYIQDQFFTLKNGKESVHKLLEDTDRKISKTLQKIITKMSIFQEKMENLYNKLIQLKDNLNHKPEKVLFYTSRDVMKQKSKLKESLSHPRSTQWHWNNKIMSSSHREHQETIQFPQPEKYYQVELKNIERIIKKKSRSTNSSETLKKVGEKEKKEKKDWNCETEKKKQKKHMKTNQKNEESKRETKRQKQTKKWNKKKNKMVEFKPLKFDLEQDFNGTSFRSKISNSVADFRKTKRKLKIKKSKLKKPFLPKLQKNSSQRLDRPCSGLRCFNSTGYWAFRWADGREEYRRHQAMGDWQFERARGRKELREEEEVGAKWQVKRESGRKQDRQEVRRDRGRFFSRQAFVNLNLCDCI